MHKSLPLLRSQDLTITDAVFVSGVGGNYSSLDVDSVVEDFCLVSPAEIENFCLGLCSDANYGLSPQPEQELSSWVPLLCQS